MTLNYSTFLYLCAVFGVNLNGSGGGGGGSGSGGGQASVFLASTANLTGYVYDNGVDGVGATLTAPSNGVFDMDGVTPPLTNILYKNDTTYGGHANGIYLLKVSSAGAPAVLERATNYDTIEKINSVGYIVVQQGTVNGGDAFYLQSPAVAIGSSNLAYTNLFNGTFGTTPGLTIYRGQTSWEGQLPYNTIVSSASIVTLTSVSATIQNVTGTINQDITAPAVTGLYVGKQYYFSNNSTALTTLYSVGGSVIQIMQAKTYVLLTCNAIVGTTAAQWNVQYGPTVPGTGVNTFLVTPSSANLLAALTDETGTGVAVFNTSPTFVTKITTPTIDHTGAVDTITVFSANSGTAITIDPANGPYQKITLTGNCVITLAAIPTGTQDRQFNVELIQDAVGGRTVSWANIVWSTSNSYSPTIGSTALQSTVITINGTATGWTGYSSNGLGIITGLTPPTGYVGEVLKALVPFASAVSLPTATVTPVTTLNYTKGNWAVSANLSFAGTTITSTVLEAFVGTASGTSTAGQDDETTAWATPFVAGASARSTAGIVTFTFSTTSDGALYLKGKPTFSVGSCVGFGSIKMTRIS